MTAGVKRVLPYVNPKARGFSLGWKQTEGRYQYSMMIEIKKANQSDSLYIVLLDEEI